VALSSSSTTHISRAQQMRPHPPEREGNQFEVQPKELMSKTAGMARSDQGSGIWATKPGQRRIKVKKNTSLGIRRLLTPTPPTHACSDDDACLKAKPMWSTYTCSRGASYCTSSTASYKKDMTECCRRTCNLCGASPSSSLSGSSTQSKADVVNIYVS